MAVNRRILTGALLMIVLWGTTLAAAGVGEGSARDMPKHWSVPEHRVGDKGRFTMTIVDVQRDETIIVQPEVSSLDFVWLDPAVRMDGEGQMHQVFRLAVVRYDLGGGDAGTPLHYIVHEFDAASMKMVAYTDEREGDEGAFYQSVRFQSADHLFLPPCGTMTPYAGKSLDTRRSVVLYPDCGDHAYWAGSFPLKSRAVGTVEGHEALFLDRARNLLFGSTDEHVWLGAEHPYPLRLAAEDPDHPGRFHVVRLASFERGHTPMVAVPLASGPGPVEWVPFDGTLPADVPGLPFAASEAFEIGTQHEEADTLRAYRQDHPDAHLAEMRYHFEERNQRYDHFVERTWSFTLFNGREPFQWQVTKVDHTPKGLTSLLPTGGTKTYYEYEGRVAPERLPLPRLDHFPPEVPSSDWLHAAWSSLTLVESMEVGLHMSTWCHDETCDDHFLMFGIGGSQTHQAAHYDDTGLFFERDSEDMIVSHLTLDQARHGTSFNLHEQTVLTCVHPCNTEPLPPKDMDLSESSGYTHAATHYATPLWGLPAPQTIIGAGLLSAFVSLLYWLWPTLKAGVWATLFSRIQGPEVAAHPARQGILDLVAAKPGISLRAAQKRLGQGRGNFDLHVRKLADAGLVKKVQGPGHIGLFIPGQAHHGLMEAATAAGSPGSRAVLDQVAASPGSSISQVARDLGLTPATVHHHVGRLHKAGLLDVQPNGRAKRLFATATGEATRALGA